MKKNAGDLKMSLKQERKLVVLERLCEGRISRTGRRRHIWTCPSGRHSGPSPDFREVKVESLIHGNTGGKPPNYVAEQIFFIFPTACG
jgi:hypothetical protein